MAELSVPGMLTRGDAFTAPVGLLLLGGRYGSSEDTELRLRLHTVPLLKGIIGIEGGAVYHARTARGLSPGLHLTGDLSILTSPRYYGGRLADAARGAVSVAAIADLALRDWVRPYVVVDNAVVLYDGSWVGSVFVGAQVSFGRFELSLETGVAGLNEVTRDRTQPYVGVGGRGALWISWGLAYRFRKEAVAATSAVAATTSTTEDAR